MGVATVLTAAGSPTGIAVLEPASNAVISGEPPGAHRIEGVVVGFVPPLLDPRPVTTSARSKRTTLAA